MTGDVLGLTANGIGHGTLDSLRVLSGHPCGDFAIAVFGNGDGRFHGGVREERHVIGCVDNLGPAGERLIDIAYISNYLAGLLGGVQEILFILAGIVGGVGAVVPFDSQLLTSLEGGPGAVGNDRYAAQRLEGVGRLEGVDGHGLRYALDLEGRLSSKDWTLPPMTGGCSMDA